MRGRAMALVGGALLLAGCSTTGSEQSMLVDSGQAAVSREFRLSQSDIAESVGLFLAASGEAAGDPPPGLATFTTQRLTQQLLIQSYAAREGVEVTRTEIEDQMEQLEADSGGSAALAQLALQAGIPPEELEETVRTELLVVAIGQALSGSEEPDLQAGAIERVLTAYSDEIGVEVAPRYGAWDDQRLVIIPGSPLSEPDEVAP